MKRIAILGCENSHAAAFLTSIRDKAEFSDVEVVGVYSDDLEASENLRKKFGVAVMNNYTDAVGKIDGLVVTARHGDNHYKYAAPYIDSGIPMFIDKPVTISEDEAVEFMTRLRENNVRISGGSCLKLDKYIKELKQDAVSEAGGHTLGGFVRAPIQIGSIYGGFYFYAQHLVEMVGEIFGRYPVSVEAKQNGDQIHVLFRYENYSCSALYCHNNSVYYAARMSESGAKSFEIPPTDDWFYMEFKEYYKLLSGNEQAMDYKDFIAPVFIMNAIVRSLESGKEENVRRIEL